MQAGLLRSGVCVVAQVLALGDGSQVGGPNTERVPATVMNDQAVRDRPDHHLKDEAVRSDYSVALNVERAVASWPDRAPPLPALV